MVKQAFAAAGATLLGALIALRLLDGTYNALVQSWYEPVLRVTAVALLLLGVVAAWRAAASGGRASFRPRPIPVVVGAVAMLPVALGFFFRPEPLGSASLTSGFGSGPAAWREFAGSGTTDPTQRNVYQWAYEFATSSPATLTGQEVDTIGFVWHAPNDAPGTFSLARFVVACCVADARGFTIPVEWKGALELKDDQWVRVRGKVALSSGGSLVVRAASVEPLDPPANPYVYP